MERLILSEQGYREQMENVVEPYLDIRKSVLWPEREEGKKIYCERYLADSPKGVVMISHGFTETAEKYKEVIYYFVKKQYHVYLPEYCGHGRSYRLIPESSLVHVDDYQRYVDDFLYVAKMATKKIRDFRYFYMDIPWVEVWRQRRQRRSRNFSGKWCFPPR